MKKRNSIILAVTISVLAIVTGAFISQSKAAEETTFLAAYLKEFSCTEITLDFVEYVTDDDVQRKEELIKALHLTEGNDLTDGNFLDGYYIYNPEVEYVTYPVSADAVYHFIDWGRDFVNADSPEELNIATTNGEDFKRYLNTYENAEPGMPFFIELKNGEVVRITEKPMP